MFTYYICVYCVYVLCLYTSVYIFYLCVCVYIYIYIYIQTDWIVMQTNARLFSASVNDLLTVTAMCEITWMVKMHAILIAQRIPSRHRKATSVSSQSCRPTLNCCQEGCPCQLWEIKIWDKYLHPNRMHVYAHAQNTLNIGLTCSRWVALVKGAWTWLTASIRALAVFAICSISTLYRSLLCFSLATPAPKTAAKHAISYHKSHIIIIIIVIK